MRAEDQVNLEEVEGSTKLSETELDEVAKMLSGFFAWKGCQAEFLDDRVGYRVLDVSHRNSDGLLHIYYGCFPADTPDKECWRELVRELVGMPSHRFEGRPVTAFKFLGLEKGISFEELVLRLVVFGG